MALQSLEELLAAAEEVAPDSREQRALVAQADAADAAATRRRRPVGHGAHRHSKPVTRSGAHPATATGWCDPASNHHPLRRARGTLHARGALVEVDSRAIAASDSEEANGAGLPGRLEQADGGSRPCTTRTLWRQPSWARRGSPSRPRRRARLCPAVVTSWLQSDLDVERATARWSERAKSWPRPSSPSRPADMRALLRPVRRRADRRGAAPARGPVRGAAFGMARGGGGPARGRGG